MDNVAYIEDDLIDEKHPTQNGGINLTRVVESQSKFEPKLWPQILAGLSSDLGAVAWGALMCWSATALPKLRESGNFGDVTEDQSSWISSVVAVGAAVVCFPAAFLLDKIGRRRTMLIFTPFYVAGWLLIYFATDVTMVVSGRVITGFAGGVYSIATPTYLAETSEPRIRGTLISGFDLGICIGMEFILIVGTYASWRMTALVCSFIPVVVHLFMFFMPESPRYLLSKGFETEASHSLRWLRGASSISQIQPELNALSETLKEFREDTFMTRFKELKKNSQVRKALVLSMILIVFQVSTGIDAILFYTVDIFRDAGSSLDEYESSMIVGAIQVMASVCAASVVDRLGRRILLLSSEILMILSLGALGVFFHIKKLKGDAYATENLGWLPLTALIVFLVGYTIGVGPVPFSVMAELLPQRVRGFAASIVVTLKWTLTFVMTRFFKNLMNVLGFDGGYWLLSSFCVVGIFYIYFFIPETKQKSLEEIQFLLNKKSLVDKEKSNKDKN